MENDVENLVEVNGIHLFVERKGHGEPLLLIPGLGAGNWLWSKSVAALSASFELIMPELRGSGRSDKPDQPYSIELFALDLLKLLDHFDIARTHVLGVSMGGLVAQYLAATWPERVHKLILAATTMGGQTQIGPSGEILCRLIKPRGRSRRERLEDAYDLNFTRRFILEHPEELEQITDWRIKYPQPEYAYYRQLLAGNAFDGRDLAGRISAPTLVLAGEEDLVVPAEDIIALKDRIPGAQLLTLKGKHLFFFEQAAAVNHAILAFLENTSAAAQVAGNAG
ncbi:MAG: alpha/beta fold hydrolase [Calditrichaeota bacterium]|nr:MAG: alpha/beta fold hydrolase [Calditrichota bacterium]